MFLTCYISAVNATYCIAATACESTGASPQSQKYTGFLTMNRNLTTGPTPEINTRDKTLIHLPHHQEYPGHHHRGLLAVDVAPLPGHLVDNAAAAKYGTAGTVIGSTGAEAQNLNRPSLVQLLRVSFKIGYLPLLSTLCS